MGNEASTEKGKCALKIKRSSQPSIGKTRTAGSRGRQPQNGGSLRIMTTARTIVDGRCFMDSAASGEQSPNSGDSTKSPGSQDFYCGREGDAASTLPGNSVTCHSALRNKNSAVGLGRVTIGSPAEVGSPGYVKKKKRTSKPHFIPNSAHLPSHFPRLDHRQNRLHSTPGMDFIEGKLRSQNLLEGSIRGGAESPTTFTSPVEEYVDSPRSVRMANEPRKNSLGERSLMNVATASNDGRKRSGSLCAQQLQSDCQAVASEFKQQPSRQGRRASSAIMPSLARLRIQQCFKNARPNVGQQILKRASSLRSEIKAFVNCLGEEKFNQLACDIYQFVTESVANIDDPEKISTLSRTFGQKHAQLSNYGFRPEFFSLFADATIAECVRLDGGAHKRCETLLAWSQLMQFMFSNVRDGYYAEIRQQRRSSLPQHKLLMKQGSTDMRNTSFDMEL